jgi:hypothetical protein
MARQTEGYVYLIQAGDMYRFKIGCASDTSRRLSELQTSSPVPLCLLGSKKALDMYEEEKRWHELFHATRKIGEWFDLTHDQLSKIIIDLRADIGIHFSKRKNDGLKIGQRGYISWDSKKVMMVDVIKFAESGQDGVLVQKVGGWEQWWLFRDEVRESPVSALFNRVTM